MTVLPRSYSRQIGATWCDRETGTPGKRCVQEVAQPQLMGRVDVGEEEADGDGDVALGIVGDARCDAAGEVLQRFVGERDERPAMEVEPLRHPKAVAALDQRLRLGPLQREVVFAVHALDVRDILEPLRSSRR